MDDMGYGDIGAYGATKQKTSNLDRMASEGVKLTSFYAAPVRLMSWAQLLTGCCDVPWVYMPGSPRGLNVEEHTIADSHPDIVTKLTKLANEKAAEIAGENSGSRRLSR